MFSLSILSGVFLGWGLGANDSANVFGIAVYTKVVKYVTAITLTAIFIIIGALADGDHGIAQLSSYAYSGGITTSKQAFLVMLAAGITVLLMTLLKLPVSSSQGVVGAIIGGGILQGLADFSSGIKFFSAWILTPIGAMIIAYVLYTVVEITVEEKLGNFRFYESFIKGGYILGGIFGAYALGANNVANVTAIFAGELNILSTRQAVIIGGISIALGVVTFSKPVMSTVGSKLVPLSKVAGLVVVVAAALTVYIYAKIGIPVSTSQAVVGAIIGIGIKIGANTINKKMLFSIFFGWFGTPTVAAVISLAFSIFIN
jgi:PiT family inorganic phosphate transporter